MLGYIVSGLYLMLMKTGKLIQHFSLVLRLLRDLSLSVRETHACVLSGARVFKSNCQSTSYDLDYSFVEAVENKRRCKPSCHAEQPAEDRLMECLKIKASFLNLGHFKRHVVYLITFQTFSAARYSISADEGFLWLFS